MAQLKARVDTGSNDVRPQQPNEVVMSQYRYNAITTVGDGTWPAAQILSGIINRSGPVAGYADTLDTAANILAAAPQLTVGDSFSLFVRNTVAFANTVAAGTGIVLGSNTAIAASLVREYLLTVLGIGAAQIYQITTVNASAVITGLTPTQAATLSPGMGVTGTGIQALTTVLGVNSTAGTVTLSLPATASGTVAGTFFPRIQVEGVRSSTL